MSANTCAAHGLRARKREATRSAITTAARFATAQKGLNGFTIEQLCEEVGVSRRTFFNYFPSKEDAIIGHLLDEFPADALAAFLAGGSAESGVERGPNGLTTTLLRDLLDLTCAMVDAMDLTRDHVHVLIAAMKVEPQLMMKMMGSTDAREHEFASIIAQREGLAPDDPVAFLAANVFGSLTRRSGQAFFSEENTRTYREILRDSLASVHQLFVYSHLLSEGTP